MASPLLARKRACCFYLLLALSKDFCLLSPVCKSVILGSSQSLCPLCSCDLRKVGRLQVETRSSPAFPLAGFAAFEDVAGLCGDGHLEEG